VLRILLDRLNETNASPKGIAEQLYRFSRAGDWPEEEFGTEPYWLDELFDPACIHTGATYEDAVSTLRAYLTTHAVGTSQFALTKPSV
jgi:hypothetical protein